MSEPAGPEPETPESARGRQHASPAVGAEPAAIVVLDASVLIGHLDDNDPHHAKAVGLLLATDGLMLGASAITLAETLVAPARRGRISDAKAALSRLGVRELALGSETPLRLARLRADLGVKLPDCCVLLAAQEHGAAIGSFDTGVIKAAHRIGLRTIE